MTEFAAGVLMATLGVGLIATMALAVTGMIAKERHEQREAAHRARVRWTVEALERPEYGRDEWIVVASHRNEEGE